MPQLSSDILERQFGPTSVKVLQQNDSVRVIETVTRDGRVLELSLVRFMPEGVQAFPKVHTAVRAGQSMGKAFRERGIAFEREETFASKQTAPSFMQKLFQNPEAIMVGVTILVGPQKLPYAQITETYTGEANWPSLSGEPTEQAKADLLALGTYLGNNV
jgi:hypothetical protein